mmetsp:Transcript_59563/g.192729  ORF Transcript_59563/g.192729 Transcript_59563/m.192729 type:complete len:366 (+) Transcript_59563:1086-2183(+)
MLQQKGLVVRQHRLAGQQHTTVRGLLAGDVGAAQGFRHQDLEDGDAATRKADNHDLVVEGTILRQAVLRHVRHGGHVAAIAGGVEALGLVQLRAPMAVGAVDVVDRDLSVADADDQPGHSRMGGQACELYLLPRCGHHRNDSGSASILPGISATPTEAAAAAPAGGHRGHCANRGRRGHAATIGLRIDLKGHSPGGDEGPAAASPRRSGCRLLVDSVLRLCLALSGNLAPSPQHLQQRPGRVWDHHRGLAAAAAAVDVVRVRGQVELQPLLLQLGEGPLGHVEAQGVQHRGVHLPADEELPLRIEHRLLHVLRLPLLLHDIRLPKPALCSDHPAALGPSHLQPACEGGVEGHDAQAVPIQRRRPQ